MRRFLGAIGATVIALSLGTGVVLAGQPGAECCDPGATLTPPGFDSGGFAKAELRYAGSDGTPSLRSGNAHAVSQYDIACYQVTSNH